MNLMILAALCAAVGGGGHAPPAGTDCAAIGQQYRAAVDQIRPAVASPESRDAIARVAYAEAGNQGDSGLAGVVYTILNRMMDGGFGGAVSTILDAPGQFEPVARAHGWQNLPARSKVEQAHIDTILNLALDGRLPDPTSGARFFQNPATVAARAANGTVPAERIGFGNQAPIAVIRDHAFYADGTGNGGLAKLRPPSVFVPVQTAQDSAGSQNGRTQEGVQPADPSRPASLFFPPSR